MSRDSTYEQLLYLPLNFAMNLNCSIKINSLFKKIHWMGLLAG